MINGIKNLVPRLAEIGKIKIGGKSEKIHQTVNKKTFQPPVKFDHFVITKLTRDAHNNLVKDEEVMKAIGNKSRSIDVNLLYDDVSMNFVTSYAFYRARQCFCRGNGDMATRIIEKKPTQVKCLGSECEYMKDMEGKSKCKPNGILSVTLPQAKKVGGVYKFRTTSWNSVLNILSSLTYIKTQTAGKLAGINFKLEMLKKHTEGHGNIDTVNIIFDGSESDLHKSALIETERRSTYKLDIKEVEKIAIQSGALKDLDSAEDVESEYYSEGQQITNKSRSLDLNADSFVTSPGKQKENEPEEKIKDDSEIL